MLREADDTLDAFHREGFWLVQPAGRGHRAGMDAMVLAAAVPSDFQGAVADLGAGAGAAGFALASRCPGARVTLVERDAVMAGYARKSLALARNAHLADRITILEADVSLSGNERVATGLADGAFDFAIMNPPFNDSTDRQSPDVLKRDAHVMDADMFEAWIRTAAAIVRPGGGMALIARPASLAAILSACANRFGGLELKPVHPHRGKNAIRVVLRGTKGSRAAVAFHPPLILHDAETKGFTPAADALCNGLAGLYGESGGQP